jgi:CPA1 family monovalent cation:H+ antiporter
MTYNTFVRYRIARHGFHPPRPMMRPTVRGGIVISWAGMRGIVTLAAAFAIPEHLSGGSPFPYRDLILLTAFCVVLGTLVLQGFTLKPLINWMRFENEDPVGREVMWARGQAYRAVVAGIEDDGSEPATMLRTEYRGVIELSEGDSWDGSYAGLPGNTVRRRAMRVARSRIVELRRTGAIGDDAYHILEAEFDWIEMSAGADELVAGALPARE